MPLLALPNELLLFVASTLPTHDLPSLIPTTRRLCHLLTPTLTALARVKYRALHHATVHGYHDAMQHLLALGVPVSIPATDNITALYKAVRIGGDEVGVRLLLEHGADPGVETTAYAHTPLLRAVAEGSEEVVKLLLESGVDPDRTLWGGWETQIEVVFASGAYIWRCEGWEERVAEMLVRYGATERRVAPETIGVESGREGGRFYRGLKGALVN